MELIYLKKDQVLAMHAYLIRKYGGTMGLRDEGLLESALAQPRQSAFGEDIYPDIFSKAAAYGFSLSENQPFVDGNKRVAVSVMGTFLMVNHHNLTATPKALYEAMIKLANKKITREALAQWLKKNSKPVKG
ncbi:MAG: type II toxin-antitoxin system death-on-curing family toxin [Deltaproteobacteria bacterium]|nr:type II toxin-antitoxin system death-on-curing family toxin [Deltaproteobacteria bacterium]